MHCPKVRIDQEDRRRFFKDPVLITLEVLFALLSVGNVLILHYLMAVVIPFPITVTWFQFIVGLVYARVLGECGKEFPRLAYFVPVKINWHQVTELIFPTTAFIAMIVLGNIVLGSIQSVALFPVAASLAVCAHHCTRFLGCGQIYRPVRWAAIILMLVGFFLASFDQLSVGSNVLPVAVAYAIAAAAYRGCFLERAMHTVRGLGNNLHNQQTMIGVIVLPFIIVLTRERRFLTYMPGNWRDGHTWLMWGCLATSAVLPFIKNIVANRLIKLGGQPPWRAIEVVSMMSIFVFGFLIFDRISLLGLASFASVFAGRTLNSMDALAAAGAEEGRPGTFQNKPQNVPVHGATLPFLNSEDDNHYPPNVEGSYFDCDRPEISPSPLPLHGAPQHRQHHEEVELIESLTPMDPAGAAGLKV